MIAAMGRALSILECLGYNNISMATITGVDIAHCNNKPANLKNPHQDLLNASIIEINRMIIDSNKARGIPTTWTASTVHAYYREVYHYLYHKMRDGCHPKAVTTSYWARVIARVIRMMKK